MPSGVFDVRGAESFLTVRRAPRSEKTPLGAVHRRPQRKAGEKCGLDERFSPAICTKLVRSGHSRKCSEYRWVCVCSSQAPEHHELGTSHPVEPLILGDTGLGNGSVLLQPPKIFDRKAVLEFHGHLVLVELPWQDPKESSASQNPTLPSNVFGGLF